ncbi:hypothetical protein H5410_057058 [Solanum commersonii]|uniref:Uncharacterized protein n=1 Tax=Solanum commersonii TaxID=4109 RepID=A0A9J5WP14_SOLCO|nr:hypothetical protein H5410_057058 [Solanum commersonii]
MSLQRKELLLSQLREKRAESKRQKNLYQSNSTVALTICTSSLSPEQASKNTNVPSNSPTGEHIVSCLSTSELVILTNHQLVETGIQQNTNNVPTQERTSDRNLRRRTRYAQMSPERKELLLSQLREKRAESKRQKNLRQSNSTAALTISTSSLSPKQASKPTNVPCTSTRGEHIVTCLSTFELGSTSTASHVASKLTSTRTTNKGRNKLEVNLQNDNLLSKDYLLLKKVPNCKFCVAKRFQYESPGFCCDNGSIRLSSHNMPTELRNLFLGDSRECQHFRTYNRAYNNMFAFTSLHLEYIMIEN